LQATVREFSHEDDSILGDLVTLLAVLGSIFRLPGKGLADLTFVFQVTR
jgi:hypothetical protein